MISLLNFHTNATRIGWHLWEIDLIFATGSPPGWARVRVDLLGECLGARLDVDPSCHLPDHTKL